MYESKQQRLATKNHFIKRLTRNLIIGICLLLLSLAIGIVGYHYFEQMTWLDAYLNASMILSGMGPLAAPKTVGGKLFAGAYALFSGIVFLISMGIIFVPVLHRFIHKFHLKDDNDKK
jgi:TRAP-type C4-dicarboxylate transport system permease small subunit